MRDSAAEFAHLIGQDIMVNNRLARIVDVTAWWENMTIHYRLYSRAINRKPGELLQDTHTITNFRDIEKLVYLKPCYCGSKALISLPNYADESAMVICDTCNNTSKSFPMGEYMEGVDAAVGDWNAY